MCNICLSPCFQFFCIYTHKWNCWTTWEFYVYFFLTAVCFPQCPPPYFCMLSPLPFLTILPGKTYLFIKAQCSILSLVSFPISLTSNSMHHSLTGNAFLFISPQNLECGTRDTLESHSWARFTNYLYIILLPTLK